MQKKMIVIKRDGREETMMFDKITSRITKLCYGLDMNFIDPTIITYKVNKVASKILSQIHGFYFLGDQWHFHRHNHSTA